MVNDAATGSVRLCDCDGSEPYRQGIYIGGHKNIGIQIEWTGSGQTEQGFVASIDADLFFSKTNIKPNYCPVGKKLVEVDPFYFRPNELHSLKGDASKAARDLGWVPKTTFKELVCEMVEEDLRLTRQKWACKPQLPQFLVQKRKAFEGKCVAKSLPRLELIMMEVWKRLET